MNIIYIFKSFLFFSSSLFKKRKYDVIFYYPAHFNRGTDTKNDFFDPFYEICNNNNISYLVIEEPELYKKMKRNVDTVPFDFMLIMILMLRKLIPLKRFDSFQHREWFIARLLKPIFFRNFTFENYIVLSNSMMGFFRGLNKDAKLFDYQHGVITSQHRGYVGIDTNAAEHIKLNDANVMVYGKGFEDVLCSAVADKYYDSHVHTVGQSVNGRFENHYGKRTVLFSLQFADPNPVFNQKILDKIVKFFEKYEDFFVSNNIIILLKHHPRFHHDIDPTPLYLFTFTKLYKGVLFDALEESFLHLTFHSTTTFEASSMGIPTLLMENNLLDPKFFIYDYNYPLGIKNEQNIIECIEMYLHDEVHYLSDTKKVFEWNKNFYSEIDIHLFVNLIKGKN